MDGRRKYAARTKVPITNSRAEVERTLERYGATGFIYGYVDDRAVVAFEMNGRQVKFLMMLPKNDDQEVRRLWRALAVMIKAKLEAVESGITVFEDEFLANIVLPDGQLVGQFMRPQIELAYDKGDMPNLLEDQRGGHR